MPARLDLSCQKFGRLTPTEFVGLDPHQNAMWRCTCDCGNTTVTTAAALRRGKTKSCGCLRRSNQYDADTQMAQTRAAWKRLIRVFKPHQYDPAWEDFDAFLRDMGPKPPKLKLTFGPDKFGYAPDNWVWGSRWTSGPKIDTPMGRLPLARAAEAYGLPYNTLYGRIKAGWDTTKALTAPARKKATP